MSKYVLTMSAVCEAETQEEAEHIFECALEEGSLKYEVEEVQEVQA